jgi:hypothetical protein
MAAGGIITIATTYTETGYLKVTWWDGTTNVIPSGTGTATKVAIGGTCTITIHSCVANGTNSGKITFWSGGGTDYKFTSINATGCLGLLNLTKWGESVLTNVNVSGCTSLNTLTVFSCPVLTSVNIAGCTALIEITLVVNAALASLDATGLNALNYLNIESNNFSAAGLNACFNTLNSTAGTKRIDVEINPGAATCNRALATAKGWTFTNL